MKILNLLLLPLRCDWTAALSLFSAGGVAGAGAAATTAGAATAAGAGLGAATVTGSVVGISAAGGVAATEAASLFSAFDALDIIDGTVTAFGVLSELKAADLEAGVFEQKAELEKLQAEIEAINGKAAENDARERMIRAMSQNIAAASSSGIDLGSGTIQTGIQEIQKRGRREIDLERTNKAINVAARRSQAAQFRLQAAASKKTGRTRAAFGLLDFARNRAIRGSVPKVA